MKRWVKKITLLLSIFCFKLVFGDKLYATITISLSHTDVSGNFFNATNIFYDGSVTATATGGTAPYTYQLYHLGINMYLNNNGYFPMLDAGTYTVTVTDNTGQMATSVPVTVANVFPIPALDTTHVIFPSACNSADGAFTLVGSGGTPHNSTALMVVPLFLPTTYLPIPTRECTRQSGCNVSLYNCDGLHYQVLFYRILLKIL